MCREQTDEQALFGNFGRQKGRAQFLVFFVFSDRVIRAADAGDDGRGRLKPLSNINGVLQPMLETASRAGSHLVVNLGSTF